MNYKWTVIYYETIEGKCPVTDFIILTHAFNKTTDKVPKSEIKKTKKFREDFLKKFKEE